MERIKVLHVHTLPVWSGSGIDTFLIMKGIRSAGYVPSLACRGGGLLEDRVRMEGMNFEPVKHLCAPLRPVDDLLALLELYRIIRKGHYDIVHTHNSKAGFLGRLAARLAGTPLVVHTVHGLAFHPAETRWRRLLFTLAEKAAGRWCDSMIAVSQPMVDWISARRLADMKKVVKIYSGIERSKFRTVPGRGALRKDFGADDSTCLIGIVAKLWAGKGHGVLIEAAAMLARSHKHARYVFAGDGPLRNELEEHARRAGVRDLVTFAGFRDDIAAVTQSLDIAVLCSDYEGMGRVILEAQVCGVPVVASRVGGIPDLVRHEETGILVPPGDSEALARALAGLMDNRDLREKLGRAGRIFADGRFDAGTMIRKTVEVYKKIKK